MRKAVWILALLAIGTSGRAQQRFSLERVRLGFRLDPMISVLKPQEAGADRNSARPGLNYGLMVDFLLNERGNYAFATGLHISMGGSTLKYDAGKGLEQFRAAPAEYKMKVQHIEIPLTLKLRTATTGYRDLAFWGQFGTYLGVPIRGRADVTTLDQVYEKENVLRDLNKINAGMLLGAGIEYPLGGELTALVGLSFQNGLVDLTRNAKWDDGKVNMNNFALRLGIYF
ncbi:porin family protein [Chitinophaga japonensis]|uniref:Outer membrane protein with beta-barrel domain n=1 Tax=Chitinophaga japonensis TaxID=104662 RepID=A0A562TCK8_CHIJA|nr:porin family protein [Chitinophaga japonensis]TWI91225.1 outer membrane protein with beta-barrel domain [Chitinophaga japonensis]